MDVDVSVIVSVVVEVEVVMRMSVVRTGRRRGLARTGEERGKMQDKKRSFSTHNLFRDVEEDESRIYYNNRQGIYIGCARFFLV